MSLNDPVCGQTEVQFCFMNHLIALLTDSNQRSNALYITMLKDTRYINIYLHVPGCIAFETRTQYPEH